MSVENMGKQYCRSCENFIPDLTLPIPSSGCPTCSCWEGEDYGCCADQTFHCLGKCEIDGSIIPDCFNYFAECKDYKPKEKTVKKSNNIDNLDFYNMLHDMTDNKPEFIIQVEEFFKALGEFDFVKLNNVRKSMGDEQFLAMWDFFAINQSLGLMPKKPKGGKNE